ncbi:outer membrane protein assembly factor BamE domain-containing protein, partial [Enterobacter hormaechei]
KVSDAFGTNNWLYVLRHQPCHEDVNHQNLTLSLSSSGVLTNIENKPALTK